MASSSSSNDPASLLNTLVTVVGTSRADLNGSIGKVTSFISEKDRYSILCSDGSIKNLKVDNLSKGNQLALSYKYKLQTYKHAAFNSPQSKDMFKQAGEVKNTLDQFLSTLPTAKVVNSQSLFIFCCVVFNLHAWFRGIVKTLLLIMFCYYPMVLFLPCWKQTRSVKGAWKLLFSSIKDALVKATGQRWISEKMVMVLFGVMAVFVVKAIITSPPSPSPGPSPGTSSSFSSSTPTMSNALIDQVYAAGFNDGTDGKLYGASLKQFLKGDGGSGSGSGSVDFAEDYSNNYPPPSEASPPPADDSLGMTGTFTLALFGKLIYDLGKEPGGGWNPAMFPVNYQTIGAMRCMMPLFGMARILPKLLKMVGFGK